jgi:predicted transcriptional regulator
MMVATVQPVAVKLDIEIRDRIKRLAESRQRTTHWMLREAIHQYVDREEKLEAFRQDAIRAWNEFQATGKHASHLEVDAWLTELANGNDTEPPECHV